VSGSVQGKTFWELIVRIDQGPNKLIEASYVVISFGHENAIPYEQETLAESVPNNRLLCDKPSK
jgi:hypothetical protein